MNYNFGVFIHNHVKYLLKAGVSARVVCPVPYAPGVMQYKSKWKRYYQIPACDVIDRVHIDYPRYICFPGKLSRTVSCYTMYYGILKTLNSAIEKDKPEILHMHTATPDGYVGFLLRKKYNLPLVCSLRGSDINIYPYHDKLTMFFTKKVISETDKIVCVSHALKTAAESIANPKYPISVVYNGCDMKTFNFNQEIRIEYREKLGILMDQKVIVFVGALNKIKGVIELINAFMRLLPEYPGLHLILVGDGEEFLTIKKIISSDSLHKKIHLVGRQPHNEISNWLNAADIFVLPTHYEGLPNVVLEAMACGLPVIATRVGGIPEVVTEDTGVLIPPKSTESLVKGIERMLTKNWDRNVIRRHIESFTWEENAQKTIKIYKNVLSKWRN